MHFNGPVWNYFKTKIPCPWIEKGGIWCVFLPDTFTFKFFLEKISNYKNMRCLRPEDLTDEFLINEFQNLNLFETEKVYVVSEAHDIDMKVLTALGQEDLISGDKSLVLFFHKKNIIFEKLFSRFENNFIKITPPKFWETQQLVDFICTWLEITLAKPAKEYIEMAISQDIQELYQALHFIKLCYPQPGHIVSAEKVKDVIKLTKLDFFPLASLINNKKINHLFRELLKVDSSAEELRVLFNSLIGHVLKIADPGFINKKNKPSRYDHEILLASSQWSIKEIKEILVQLSNLEIMAREKSVFLNSEIEKYCLISP